LAALYSIRFLAFEDASPHTYVVPADHTAIIRCVTAVNATGGNSSYYNLQLKPSNTYVLAGAPPVAALGTDNVARVHDVRIVVAAGESFVAQGSGGVHVSVSGYLFASL